MSDTTQKTLNVAHVDMDAFFARVEKLDNPELSDKPVVVGGLGKRGVVSTACYRAREYGITSAMPMEKARDLCPHAEFLSTRGQRYQEISQQIKEIFNQTTPQVNHVSLDEAYLGIHGVLHHYESPKDLAETLRDHIYEETSLTASVGIGPNTMIAKLASDHCKPDGSLIVTHSEREPFLRNLDIDEIPGIGPQTQKKLTDEGITTVDDLQDLSVDEATRRFGKNGVIYKQKAHGRGSTTVDPGDETKSISNEETYEENIESRSKLLDKLYNLTEKVAYRLRNQNYSARTIFIKIRRGDFTTLTRQRTFPDPLSNTETIWETVERTFKQDLSIDSRGVRLQGVGVTNLEQRNQQSELFEDDRKNKRRELNELIDSINEELGDQSVVRAREIDSDDEGN